MNHRKPTALIAALILLTTLQPVLQAASSLPTGGTFAAGSGNISAAGNTLTINQNTLKGIINWNTFSLASGATVNFNNGHGATLNRVTGTTPTSLFGQLLATGSVYLLNPEGILIGHGATIHTGGDFLATTLTLPNSSFLANTPLNFSGNSTATVVNLGALTSTGGNIYLIGHTVTNNGNITSPNGTTGLAAGSQVLITDSSSNQKVSVQAPGGDVTNTGFISAAQAELKSNGGNIYALAGNNGGQINATGTATQDGHIWLIAKNGTTNVSGTLTATNANGTGGDIETSGSHVSTSAATIKTGQGGNWLLDPDDLTIDSTLAATIDSTLNGGTNVTEQTSAPVSGGNGDILVNSPIAWTTGANLTLSAYHNVNVGANISNTGSGNLAVRADNTSTGTGTISFTNSAILDWSGSTGNVALLYNPSSYATPTDYSSKFGSVNGAWTAPADSSVSSQYTAYMLVNNVTDLQNINNNINSNGVYALGQNINASANTNFSPLASGYAFEGILDGFGHTIDQFTISNRANTDEGLFSDLGPGGIVRNLAMTNVSIGGPSADFKAGAIAGQTHGLIANASSSGDILAGSGSSMLFVGGIAGQNTGTIANSSSSVAASDTNSGADVGGLVGTNTGTITNSFATGAVSSNAATTGGLVGYNNGTISGSYATGTVTSNVSGSTSYGIGGLIGNNDSSGTVSNSYATGSVTLQGRAYGYLGGLIGYNLGTISNSYASGVVTDNGTSGTTDAIGGLVGDLATGSGSLTNSYATGNVTGQNPYEQIGGLVGVAYAPISDSYATGTVSANGSLFQLGGLVGRTLGSATITSSYATGSVMGGPNATASIGGLVGIAGPEISDSYASGAVTGSGNNAVIGGLAGASGAITNSYATGVVTETGGDTPAVGGLVGKASGAISGSYASGSVTATAGSAPDLGGLVGVTNSGGTITSSYATGAVTASASASGSTAGGLVGHAQDTITQSYATGSVSGNNGDSYLGGLVGYTTSNISISYALGAVSGLGQYSSVGGLVGLTSGSPTISDTYARGNVTGGPIACVGGLVGCGNGSIATSYASGQVTGGSGASVGGLTSGNLTVTSSYFDNTVNPSVNGNGFYSSTGITGESTATLQSGTMPTGFNPSQEDSPWVAPAGVYPYFGWQGSLVTVSGTAYNGTSVIPSASVGALSNGALLGTVSTNGSGFYTLLQPQNMVASGVLTYLASNGTANTFSDGGGTNNFTGMDLHVGSLNLISSSATMSGLNAALATALGSNTGSNFLFAPPSGELSPVPGTNVTLTSSAPTFSLDQPISSSGNILINTSGNLSIPANSGLAANNITLVTAGTFTNNAGSGALSVAEGGNWNVYSQNPANDTTGGLTPSFIQYNATYGVTTPDASGNGLFYTLAPVITASLTGTISKTYDGTTTATLTPSNFTYTGAVQGDTVTLNTPTTGTYASASAGTGLGVTASGISILAASNGSIPVYGYQLTSSTASANIGTILAAPAPTPTPGPTPAPTNILTININAAAGLVNQIPTFSATYAGPAINGLNIESVLGSLTYTITPFPVSGPGVYKITATGIAPDGYTLNIAPAYFTVVGDTPSILPTQITTNTLLPVLLPDPLGLASGFLSPGNALGFFQIDASTGNISQNGFNGLQTPLAQSSFFSTLQPATFAAGVKP